MSLYRPETFATRDPSAIDALLCEHDFATLVTPTTNGEPFVSHVPLLHVKEPLPHGVLLGHVARANPHWHVLESARSIAIFHGPHAYVSPSWYAMPEQAVPTWNYAVAHVKGRAHLIERENEALDVLAALVARHESGRDAPWPMDRDSRTIKTMVRAIVAFRFEIESIDAKLKLSQNRSEDDRRRVAGALQREAYAEAKQTAQWMERFGGSS